jgi:hypothetical protein
MARMLIPSFFQLFSLMHVSTAAFGVLISGTPRKPVSSAKLRQLVTSPIRLSAVSSCISLRSDLAVHVLYSDEKIGSADSAKVWYR